MLSPFAARKPLRGCTGCCRGGQHPAGWPSPCPSAAATGPHTRDKGGARRSEVKNEKRTIMGPWPTKEARPHNNE